MVFLYKYKGVDPSNGLYSFEDYNGNQTTNPFDARPSTAAILTTPKFAGGLTNSFSYKSFSLSVQVQFTKQTGIKYYYDPIFFVPGSFNVNQPTALLEKKSGDRMGI